MTHFQKIRSAIFVVGIAVLLHGETVEAQSVEGFAEPVQTVDVATPEAGTIQQILVKQGQRVKKGDPLVQMDQETLLPALDLARAKAKARSKLEAATIETQVKQRRLDNLSRLGKENSSSEEIVRATADVELAKTQVMAAEEEILQSELEAKRIEVQLGRRLIRSPINGIVTKIHHQEGESVTTAEPALITIVDLSQLRIVVHPTSEEAESLGNKSDTHVRIAGSSTILPAQIDFVSPVTNADSGTVRVELLLDNSEGKFRSGLRCWLVDPKQSLDVPTPIDSASSKSRNNF